MALHSHRFCGGPLKFTKSLFSLSKLHAVRLSAPCVPTFTALKSNSQRSSPQHVIGPLHMTKKTTKYRTPGMTMLFQGMQGHQPPFSKPFHSLPAHEPPLPCVCRAAGRARRAGVSGTLNHIQRRLRGREERKIYATFTSLARVIYGLAQRRSGAEESSTFNRTVRCLQSRLVFLVGSPT